MQTFNVQYKMFVSGLAVREYFALKVAGNTLS